MNYSTIREIDTANCIGVGVSLFVSGCRNKCEGCFQKETWNFKYGNKYGEKQKKEIADFINRDYIDSFSVLGGDPFEPENLKDVADTIKMVRDKRKDIKIYIWSGYLYENLVTDDYIRDNILRYCDYLIDGKFENDKKDLSLTLRGSSNQRIIDLRSGINVTEEFEGNKR